MAQSTVYDLLYRHGWREKFFPNIVFESMNAVKNKVSEASLSYETHPDTVQSITAFKWIKDNL